MFRGFSSLQRNDYDNLSAWQPEKPRKDFVPSASVVENGTKVLLLFDRKEKSTFHAPWLWSNDPSWVHPTSGQRLRTPGGYSSGSVIKSAVIANPVHETKLDGVVLPFPPPPKGSSHPVGNVYNAHSDPPTGDSLCLRVTWESPNQKQTQVSYYDLDWLRQWRYDEEALERRRDRTKATTLVALRSDGAIPTFDYDDMESDAEEFAFQLVDVSMHCHYLLLCDCFPSCSNK